jgi:hypothetical protein
MRPGLTKIEVLTLLALFLLLGVCVSDAIVLVPVYVAVGWIPFLYHFAINPPLSGENVAIGIAAWFALLVGTHIAIRWLRSDSGTPWPWRKSACLVALLTLGAWTGVALLGACHQMTWLATSQEPIMKRTSRGAANTQSLNNLKQIGLAEHGYHDEVKHLTLGGTFDAQGNGMHGWQTFLLPYLEQNPLFKKIDFSKPWNDPANADAMATYVPVLLHPLIDDRGKPQEPAFSHYPGNSHLLRVQPIKIADIKDGTSNTILAGSAAKNFSPWGSPFNLRDPALGFHASHGFGSPNGPHVQIVFADGSVRMLSTNTSPAVLRALATPNGGETVPEIE